MNHFHKFIHDHLDIIQVIGAGATGIGTALTNIDLFIKLLIGLATLGYIIRKWYLMEKRK